MALAKKCDICGELYECYAGRNGISFERIGQSGVVIKTEKTLDCCPECMYSITKFLEERMKGNGRGL